MEAVNNIMELIRKSGVVFGIVAAILILVVLRSTGNNFKPDAEKWAQPSLADENIITSENLQEYDDLLVIYLDESKNVPEPAGNQLKIAPASILDKQNIKKIKEHKGTVLLASSDPSLSAGIWMILSQMGMKNIFIFSEEDDEVRKNEFRPDTLVRPEL